MPKADAWVMNKMPDISLSEISRLRVKYLYLSDISFALH